MHQVQVLLHDGRYLAALRAAGPLATDPDRPAEERVEAALVAARAAGELAMYPEARRYALLAKEQTQDPELLAQASHYLGTASVELHEPDDAEMALLTALAREGTDYVARARPTLLYNLALAYEQRRQDSLAVHVYCQAADQYLAVARRRDALHCWQNAGWIELVAKRLESGRRLLSRASEYLNEVELQDRANQYAMLAYLYWLEDDGLRAVELTEELLAPGRVGVTPWARTLAAVTAAEVAIKEERRDLAASILRKATEWITESGCVKLCNLLADVRRRAGA